MENEGLGFRAEARDPENGTYYIIIIGCILGLFKGNGKENGSFYTIIGYILGFNIVIHRIQPSPRESPGCRIMSRA